MASVRCDSIVKDFDDVQVLKSIDLDIQDGEFVVFVGPSGCGKTTLLRLIAGLETVTAGNLIIDQEIVNHVPPKDRNIAMVFQNYAIYPHMTVADNIGFGMKLRGGTKAGISVAVKEAADMLGLTDLLQRKPSQLSGGQRQRVAMGRAIVRKPAVFLMDEPLSNLDAELRNQMRVEIKSLQHRLRTTTIYVTHDQTEAMTLADRIAVMNDGEIQQFGAPGELYARPKNKFVAGFIGSPRMNFMAVDNVDEEFLILRNGCRLRLAAAFQNALADYPDVDIGVRPESIRLVAEPNAVDPGKSAGWWSSVRLCEELGSETIVHFESGSETLQVKVGREINVHEGDRVGLSFDMGAIHLFCRKTGVCIVHAPEG